MKNESNIGNIEKQMKKGILEYIILLLIGKGEIYSTEIILTLKQNNLIVVEGTLYPLLSRLRKEGLLSYSWIESTEGPPRKYYTLTKKGKETLSMMKHIRKQLQESVEGIENI